MPSSTAAAIARDSSLTAPELEQAHLFLQQTGKGIAGAIKGLSEAQWRFKTRPDRWSIAEIVDHVIIVQEYVLGPVRDALGTAPEPAPGRDAKAVDAIIIHQFANRLSKFTAPEIALPSARYAPAHARSLLTKNYVRLAEYLEAEPDLRKHALPAPPMKAVSQGIYDSMDGYQWILAAAAHTERHTKQILEVMADDRFPEHGSASEQSG